MKPIIALLVAMAALQCRGGDTASLSGEDRVILERYLEHARARRIDTLPLHRRVVETALFFLGTPYRAGTLDENETEQLVVNLREMDCVTFVDNVLALALLPSSADPVDRFLDNLRRVRYRDGKIIDLASRLHYSTDWLFEMQRQGILKEIARQENIPFTNKVNHLARHHPAAAKDAALRDRLLAIEKQINARTKQHLPKDRVQPNAGQLRDGDVILITTTREGLDAAHLGFALERDNTIYLLHASSDARAVVITTVPLGDYLARVRAHAGIITGRIIE
ncbi:MAG: DUF1460 domain-containing protein [Odoribacteraceae bacterium]|jgi:hypothetical protein|nr:DUF1460 domain-containing protein [Odoribacteraceae bacterium]